MGRIAAAVLLFAACSEAPAVEPDPGGTASATASAEVTASPAAAPGPTASASAAVVQTGPRPFTRALAWSSSGDLFAARNDAYVRVKRDGSEVRVAPAAFDNLDSLLVTEDGSRLLAVFYADKAERAEIIETATGASKKLSPPHAQGGALNADGSIIAVGGFGGLTIVEGATGKTLCEIADASLFNGAFSADSSKLYATAVGGHSTIDVKACTILGQGGTENAGGTSHSVVSPAGGLVAAAGDGGHFLELLPMDPFTRARRIQAAEVGCTEHFIAAFNRSGTLVFDEGAGTRFVVYDPSGRRIAKWQGDKNAPADRVAGFDDGKRFARVLSDRLEVRTTKTGKVACETRAIAGAGALSISPDQTMLAVVSDEALVLVDAEDCSEIARFSP